MNKSTLTAQDLVVIVFLKLAYSTFIYLDRNFLSILMQLLLTRYEEKYKKVLRKHGT